MANKSKIEFYYKKKIIQIKFKILLIFLKTCYLNNKIN